MASLLIMEPAIPQSSKRPVARILTIAERRTVLQDQNLVFLSMVIGRMFSLHPLQMFCAEPLHTRKEASLARQAFFWFCHEELHYSSQELAYFSDLSGRLVRKSVRVCPEELKLFLCQNLLKAPLRPDTLKRACPKP